MKVQISQRYVYHKVATIELEIDRDNYQQYLADNKGYHSLDDYLLENEDFWLEKIDEATENAELEFGFGCGVSFNECDSESELRYDCKELQIGGHL